MRLILAILILLPTGLRADSLCGVTDQAALLNTISGVWRGDTYLSAVNAVVDRTKMTPRIATDAVKIGANGGLGIETLQAAMPGQDVQMALAPTPVYDVDQVDDLLDTTDAAVLADLLSDTPCGPESLPQLVADIDTGPDATDGVQFNGQVVLIPYFDDRILRLDQFDVNTGETVLFITLASVLTRD